MSRVRHKLLLSDVVLLQRTYYDLRHKNSSDYQYARQYGPGDQCRAKQRAARRQIAEHDAAWKRRVEKRAEELRLEREANALLDSQETA